MGEVEVGEILVGLGGRRDAADCGIRNSHSVSDPSVSVIRETSVDCVRKHAICEVRSLRVCWWFASKE